MASIERRQIRGQERFLVRYGDPSGKQKARTFVSENAAVDYEAEVRTDMRRGACRRSMGRVSGGAPVPALLCASWFSLQGISVSTSASASLAWRP